MNSEQQIDAYLTDRITDFLQTVPYAKHLIEDDTPLDNQYYIRHRIETVNQIRMTSKMNCIALSKMIDHDYDLARQWGLYTIQEMNHDKMFMKDLNCHGVTNSTILSTQPFLSTRYLVKHLVEQIERTNSGLPAICYSLFAEWNAAHFAAKAADRVSKTYSDQHVIRSRKHIEFDQQHNHYPMILNLAQSLSVNDEEILDYLKSINDLFCDYFYELYVLTILKT